MRYIVELEQKVQILQTEATTLAAQLNLLQRNSAMVATLNNELRFRLQAMEQQAQLRDGVVHLQLQYHGGFFVDKKDSAISLTGKNVSDHDSGSETDPMDWDGHLKDSDSGCDSNAPEDKKHALCIAIQWLRLDPGRSSSSIELATSSFRTHRLYVAHTLMELSAPQFAL
ncbi:hypothetical protein ZWY2020_026553 [Hordeum vulgare]|nr:hypothetical protein ZWY2020_026553 [Hordeum vulgare]